MRHGFQPSWLLLPLLVVGACRGADRAREEAALLRADREFAEASAREGRMAWLRVFAEEAAIAPAGAPFVRGLPAIRDYYARTEFSPGTLRWTPLDADVSAAGDLGYTIGTWELPGDGGRRPAARGKYVTIWRKQATGSWKVVLDLGNAEPIEAHVAAQPLGPQ